MPSIRKLGVLTSGGDCPGLNAVIRGITLHATETYGCEVFGIHEGHHGLLGSPPNIQKLSPALFSGELLRVGGTMLGSTTTDDPFAYPLPNGGAADRSKEIIKAIVSLKLDGLVVIGGDGSMRIFDRLLTDEGIPWVGVPKTIDNDVPGTDFAVGFFTAVDVVGSALDRLQSTAASHRRIMVLETMGRESGFLALYGGIAGGADAILIPERAYEISELADHVCRIRSEERGHVLVVVAEGVQSPSGETISLPYYGSNKNFGGIGTIIAEELGKRTSVSTRCTVLGHLQRGGSPSMFDRLLGSALSVHAVDVLLSTKTPRLAAWRAGRVTDVPMSEVIDGPRKVIPETEMLAVAKGLGIYTG